jgi:hypothetical protein
MLWSTRECSRTISEHNHWVRGSLRNWSCSFLLLFTLQYHCKPLTGICWISRSHPQRLSDCNFNIALTLKQSGLKTTNSVHCIELCLFYVMLHKWLKKKRGRVSHISFLNSFLHQMPKSLLLFTSPSPWDPTFWKNLSIIQHLLNNLIWKISQEYH